MDVYDIVAVIGMLFILVPIYVFSWQLGSIGTGLLLILWAVKVGTDLDKPMTKSRKEG